MYENIQKPIGKPPKLTENLLGKKPGSYVGRRSDYIGKTKCAQLRILAVTVVCFSLSRSPSLSLAILAPSWAILAASRAILAPSWPILDGTCRQLHPNFVPLAPILPQLREKFSPKRAKDPKQRPKSAQDPSSLSFSSSFCPSGSYLSLSFARF